MSGRDTGSAAPPGPEEATLAWGAPAHPDPAWVRTLGASDMPAVLCHLFGRYAPVCQPGGPLAHALGEDLAARTAWICDAGPRGLGGAAPFSLDKAQRWLGFVQGVLVAAGVLEIEQERDYTRPLFHAVGGVAPTWEPPRP